MISSMPLKHGEHRTVVCGAANSAIYHNWAHLHVPLQANITFIINAEMIQVWVLANIEREKKLFVEGGLWGRTYILRGKWSRLQKYPTIRMLPIIYTDNLPASLNSSTFIKLDLQGSELKLSFKLAWKVRNSCEFDKFIFIFIFCIASIRDDLVN